MTTPKKTDKEIIDEATEAAINAGCKVIQDHMGVSGDVAGIFFGASRTGDVEEIFAAYFEAERMYQ